MEGRRRGCVLSHGFDTDGSFVGVEDVDLVSFFLSPRRVEIESGLAVRRVGSQCRAHRQFERETDSMELLGA